MSKRQQMCVRVGGEEVWAERDVVSDDSVFIPPWGVGCHCWIPAYEAWRPIPVGRIIQRRGSDVSDAVVDTSSIAAAQTLILSVLRGTVRVRAESAAEEGDDEASHGGALWDKWNGRSVGVYISEQNKFKMCRCMRVCVMYVCNVYYKKPSLSFPGNR